MTQSNSNQLETTRLYLRPIAEADLSAMFELNNDPDVMRYINNSQPWPREKTEARFRFHLEHWARHNFGLMSVIHKEQNRFIGACGLVYLENTPEIEIGYRFAKEFWGRGLATEAAEVCLKYGFEVLQLDRIVAVIDHNNIASRRVIEKIGLRYEKDAHFYETDLGYYAISRAACEKGKSVS